MTRDQIIRAQRAINDAMLGPIPVDGIYGPRTAAAYAELLRQSDTGGFNNALPVPPAPKPWWQSRAVLGSLSGIVAGAAGLAGWSLDAGSLTDVLTALLTTGAGLLAFVGTVKRSAPIERRLLPAAPERMQRDALPSDSVQAGREKPTVWCDL